MAVDAGSIYSSVRIRLDSLDGDIKGVYARLDALESQITQKMDKPTKAVTASFNGMSLAGIAAFVGINKAIKSVVGTYASFEQSMANVASVAGASSAEFDQLTNAAEKAGETTRFTASQAADGLYYLASAGYSAQQSVDALNGVLTLAQATGSDLASTSASMAATISQFGLQAEDAGRVANVFAAAITSSQANMDKLTTGLRQVGPVAGTLGISLEEVTANLDALYNKGFQGEQAGTALRSILLDLVDPSSDVVKQLKAQGVEYDKVNPRIVGLSGAFENMAKAGVDLTTVFNKVSASEALALIQTAKDGTKNLKTLQDQITGTNKAMESAKRQNNDLSGDLDMLKSEAEATGNKFGKEFTPALRDLAQAAKVVVGWIGQLPTPLLAVVGSAATVIAGITGITGALSLMGITISATVPVLAGIGIALTAIVTAGTLVAKHFADQQHITEQLNAATESLKSTSKEYNDVQNTLKDSTKNLTDAEKALYEARKQSLALEMQKKLIELSETYDKVAKSIENNKNKQEEWETKANAIKKVIDAEGTSSYNYAANVKALNNAISKAADYNDKWTTGNKDLQGSISEISKLVYDGTINVTSLTTVQKPLYDAIMNGVNQLKNAGIDKITQEIQNLGNLNGDEFKSGASKINSELRSMFQNGQITFKKFTELRKSLEAMKPAADKVIQDSDEWKQAIKKALGLDPKTFTTESQAVQTYTASIKQSLNSAVTDAKESGKSTADVYTEYANKVQSAIEKLLQSGSYTEDEATIKSLEKLRDEFKQGINTSSFDDEITKLNNMIVAAKEGADAVEKLNVKMQHPDWDTEQIDEYIAKEKELKNTTDSMGISMEEWQGYAQNAITGALSSFEALGEAVVTGGNLWSAYAGAALGSIASVLEAMGSELAISAAKQFIAAAISASNIYTAWMAPGQAASGAKAAAGSALAYTAAGLVKGWASNVSNMATGGIVEPTSGGTITRQAENGYGEVDYNVGPTGRAHTQQMGSAIAQELVNLGVVGSSVGQTINLVLDGKQIARVVTRRQNNGDY